MRGTTHRVLVVDDVEDMLDVCAETLRMLDGVEVVTELDARNAVALLHDQGPFDALVADIRMARMDGVELLKRAREHDPGLPVVMLTGDPGLKTAVECLRLGAVDYLTKPMNPGDLQARVLRCLRERRLPRGCEDVPEPALDVVQAAPQAPPRSLEVPDLGRAERAEPTSNVLLRRQVERDYADSELVGSSPAMRAVVDLIDRVAGTDVDVLVTGEGGSGKELVARAIHARSGRRARPLVPIDFAAIPEGLLEGELFGSERGATSPQAGRSIGLLELAAGGTVFLDELGELPPLLQPKLLRALQERRLRRLGGGADLPIDARVVAATGRNPAKMVERGELRQDLFYRLGAVTIALPPLRERGDDVRLLAEHFRARFASELRKPVAGFTHEALAALREHRWPGNVRELQNVVRRGVALARGTEIGVDDLPPTLGQGEARGAVDGTLAEARARALGVFEREYLIRVLRRHEGDVLRSMAHAGVSRASFYRMLRAHGLRAAEFRPGAPPTGAVTCG